MSSDVAISVVGLGKCYRIYDKPMDRLAQMLSFGRKGRFREFWALHEASFSIGRGETVGIIGCNGSGKSTLLQMICGTVSSTIGTVTTRGRIAALLELGAGFNPEFTGRENVLMNAAILGFSRETMQERMVEVLEFSELGDFLNQPVKTYSSGMYARLAFSIAIHVDPEILIVDEALAVGDSRFVAKCMRRIKEIQDRGTTILFVSHDVGSVRTLCQRAIWLDKGRVVEDGDVFPVTGKYMEFMFRDEDSEEQRLREAIVTSQDAAHEANDPQVATASVLTSKLGSPFEHELDTRPTTHWGSHKGLILGASVCDAQGTRRDVLGWGKLIEVVLDVSVPLDIPRENLSIAFSIKDLKGTDLIVSTTHDQRSIALPNQESFRVSFCMVNPLVTGKYLLVAAVENRLHRDIHYYEYFEGAHYFSSLAEDRFFGIFQPAILQSVKVL